MLLELNIFKDVVKKLNMNKIPYMISGSVAMNYYTIPRMTRGIDIVIEIDSVDNFYNTFKEEYYIDREMVSDAIKNQYMFSIISIKEVMKIDFIIRKKTEYCKAEFKRRRQVIIEGVKVYIVSIEDLIISKLLWAEDSMSELQIKDVKNLLEEKVDMKYIHSWTDKLNISSLLKEIMGGS